MNLDEILLHDNVLVVSFETPIEKQLRNLENMKLAQQDEELLKMSREEIKYRTLLNKMYKVFSSYNANTQDKDMFCTMYQSWLMWYLKCIGKSMRKEYVSEEIQDMFHTFSADLKKNNLLIQHSVTDY